MKIKLFFDDTCILSTSAWEVYNHLMEASANPKNRTGLAITLVVLVFILIGVFLLLDFHVVRGQAKSESQVSTYTFGIDEDSKLPFNQVLYVYVMDDGGLERELASALKESLTGNPYIGTIEIRGGTPAAASGSVLVVEITQPDILWTPFYSRAKIEMQAAYASDGEVDWIAEEAVNLENSEPQVRLRGDYQMQASASGLMSMPGTNSYLAQQLADQIEASLMERLTSANSQ